VQALAAGGLRPAIKPFRRESIAEPKTGLDHKSPLYPLAWIEIENQHVRVLDIVHGRTPRMDLDNPHIDQAQDAGEFPDPKRRAGAALCAFRVAVG
jgi:hypothetical protein